MQNTITFHPILDIPNIEKPASSLDTVNEQGLASPIPQGTPKVRQSNSGYRFRRVLVGVALVLLGAFLWTIFAHVTGLNDQSVGADLSPDAPREIYTVQSGDTLWSIAMGIDTDGDPRDTIDRLAALNGGSALYIGQKLMLNN
ncbi:MAG: LysM peptidoglycan-binding domain-containing protein [Actinomycetota bacterium]|nr:LysM peptidoglycan-binding domain-containing protein [Actinomycetota bacterium]